MELNPDIQQTVPGPNGGLEFTLKGHSDVLLAFGTEPSSTLAEPINLSSGVHTFVHLDAAYKTQVKVNKFCADSYLGKFIFQIFIKFR